MTHLAPYSYVDRLEPNVLVFAFLAYYCFWLKGAVSEFSYDAIFLRANLRPVILSLYLLALLIVISYDVIVAKIKYEEGFVDTCLVEYDCISLNGSDFCRRLDPADCPRGVTIAPSGTYSTANVDMLTATDALWNIACTLRNSALFLLLASFNSTVKDIFPKPLMKRWEVRAFTVYSVFSVALYFIFRELGAAVGRSSSDYSESLFATVFPQFLYSFELLMICALLLATNWRIRRMTSSRFGSARPIAGGRSPRGKVFEHHHPHRADGRGGSSGTKMSLRRAATQKVMSTKPAPQQTKVQAYLLYVQGVSGLLATACFMDFLGLFVINIDIVLPVGALQKEVFHTHTPWTQPFMSSGQNLRSAFFFTFIACSPCDSLPKISKGGKQRIASSTTRPCGQIY